jgi:hypothetical protein
MITKMKDNLIDSKVRPEHSWMKEKLNFGQQPGWRHSAALVAADPGKLEH